MPTPYESATLNLKLFELRREPVLREARDWFILQFHPETFDEVVAALRSNRNSSMRMVIGYWDMASSMVTTGAIDRESFMAAHGEIIGAFSKIHPFLPQIRNAFGENRFCKYIEEVVMAEPEAEAIMARRRERLRGLAKDRAAQAQAAGD